MLMTTPREKSAVDQDALTTDFDWGAIEPDENTGDEVAMEIFTSTLAWLISFCLSRQRSKGKKTMGGGANLKVGYRRFIALCYIYRPELLDGRTIRALSKELKVSRQEVNKFITDISLEFDQQGSAQKSQATRAVLRAAQLRRHAEQNTQRSHVRERRKKPAQKSGK